MRRALLALRLFLLVMLFFGSAGCAAVGVARAFDIIRDEPLICEYLPWWPGCGSSGDGSGGGGSGAGLLPQ